MKTLQGCFVHFLIKYHPRMQHDSGNRHVAVGILVDRAFRAVDIADHFLFRFRGNGEEGQHVAAGRGSNHRLIRIDPLGTATIHGRR